MNDTGGETSQGLARIEAEESPETDLPAGDPPRYVLGPDGKPLIGADGHPIIDRRRSLDERRPKNPRVSVVVPAKNEAPNIREILPYLKDFYEVIVVVNQADHEDANAAREALPTAKIVYQTRKGKGNALACGFAQVTGDAVVMFDIDGSADPHEIPRFVKALTDGADLAKGSRYCRGGGSEDLTIIRSLGNKGLNLLASILTSTRFTDLCYGYNAFWADQLYMLDLPKTEIPNAPTMVRGDGFEIEALIIGRFALSGAAITEVPSFEHDRYHGHSNLNAVKDGLRVLWTLLQDRLYARKTRSLAKRRELTETSGPKRPGWMTEQAPSGVRRIQHMDPAESSVDVWQWNPNRR